MRAITRDRYGNADVLRLRDVDRPEPAADELLIRVHAASVSAGVKHMMTGEPYLMRLVSGLRAPKDRVLGVDAAGVVAAVGEGVTLFRPGDAVYAELRAGAFAEYACVPQGSAAPKPANLTFEAASAVPSSATAALMGLRDVAKVGPGLSVAVNGASGGVGTFAVQIAKSLGAHVTGVCGASKVDLVRSIGADDVIDYTRDDLTRGDRRYDVIFDLVANHALAGLRRALTPTGMLLMSSGRGGRWIGPMGRILAGSAISPFVRQTLRSFGAGRSGAHLLALKDLIESGAVTPIVDRVFPLAETADAMRYFDAGHARGKIVIAVA